MKLKNNYFIYLILLVAFGACETKPVITPEPAAKTVDMFNNDAALKEQEAAALAAKIQRDKEDKERKDRERKEKEERDKAAKEAKKAAKKQAGPGWFERTFDKFSKEIFSDDNMK